MAEARHGGGGLVRCSQRQGEFGEGCSELVMGFGVGGEFVVAAAEGRVTAAHCCAAAPSEPGGPLVAALDSGSRVAGRILQICGCIDCSGGWLVPVAVGVHEAVAVAGVTVRAGHGDLGVRSRNSRGCVVVGGVTVGHAAGRCEGFAGQVGGCFHA